MIELLMAALLPQSETPAPAPRLVGVVGICVRWEADPLHVAEVVVVRPSGNPTLDAAMAPTAKATNWPKVAGDTGGWTGRWVSMGGVPIPPGPQPDCSHLPAHKWPPA
ncbi:MAG: hypothetical protein JWR59_1377 [Brevundimonas sp.]|nr:hypothetical protein [Brevundimonas sp.]